MAGTLAIKMLSATDILAKKRDGAALSSQEIAFFVRGVTEGSIPDYQAAAWLMAIYLRGMDAAETAALTLAMAHSGETIPPDALPQPALDKHSTGGVGDKTTLIVVPILAACGVYVGKMSGRGLGHTGGTLDKLEAVPGLGVEIPVARILEQTRSAGACLAGQTGNLVPADRILYALRDVTATVGSLPLIVASILSKKLAGGAGAFLFDVKAGDGALMKSLPEARALAEALVEGAEKNGRRAVAILSDMSQPLGRSVGNALEVSEALEVLDPETSAGADARLKTLCAALAAEGLRLARGLSPEDAEREACEALRSGAALDRFQKLLAAQGGDLTKLPVAPVRVSVLSPAPGWVASVGAREIGELVVSLGGGRRTRADRIDPSVGVVIHAPVGSQVRAGDPLATIHAASERDAEAAFVRLKSAFALSVAPVEPPLLMLGKIGGNEDPYR